MGYKQDGLLEFLLAFLLTSLMLTVLWFGWKGLEALLHVEELEAAINELEAAINELEAAPHEADVCLVPKETKDE